MSELPVSDWSLDLELRRGPTAVLLIFGRIGVWFIYVFFASRNFVVDDLGRAAANKPHRRTE